MKNTLAIYAGLMLSGFTAFAQTEATETTASDTHSFKSVHGHEVLPQKGDWGLGVSATGFLGYFGNLMNGNNAAPTFNNANGPSAFSIGNLGGMAVMGKYMRTSTLAYRVRFQANFGSVTNRNFVAKSLPTPDPLNPILVEDSRTTSSHVVLLSAGFEKRRGAGRLQGFYGAEAIVGTAGGKAVYSYGNGFSIDYPAPVTTTNFDNGNSSAVSTRTKENFSGTTMLFGARGFAGVEYFFAPRMSLGGEVGYTLGFSTNSKGYNTTEQWNSGGSTTATVTTDKYPNSGLRSFGAGLDNVNAGINLHFYF